MAVNFSVSAPPVKGGSMIDSPLSLRLAASSDEALLLRIFAESHCAGFELLGLQAAALAGLVRMQFQAREGQYRMHPGAAQYLICREGSGDGGPQAGGGVVVGSCWISDTTEQLRVLDIAVLVEHRRQGVARTVLGELCARAAAAGKAVGLSVWHANAGARELYRALGFAPDPTVAGAEPGDLGNGYLELRCLPGAAAQPRAGVR